MTRQLKCVIPIHEDSEDQKLKLLISLPSPRKAFTTNFFLKRHCLNIFVLYTNTTAAISFPQN